MIGFVLSGGANLGSVHVGMLQALLEAGIKPDVIVGTSIGAVNAGYLAGEPSLAQVDGLRELWCDARAREIFPLNPLANARALFKEGALFSSHGWRRFVEQRAPYRNLEDAAVPVRITATDYEEGRSVTFDSGSLVDAIIASTALPGVFPPYPIGDRLFIDGAISEQLPLKVVLEAGADTIYVMAVSVPSPPTGRRTPLRILRHSVTILLYPRIRLDALDLPGDHPSLRIIQVPSVKTEISLWDMSRHDELIDTAYETTKKFLEAEHDDDRVEVATVPEMEIATQRPDEPAVKS